MTAADYRAMVARIDKAESLPREQLEPFLTAYHGLCTQAAAYEREAGRYFDHSIHDKLTREIVRKLIGDVERLLHAADAPHAAHISDAVLSDLMALIATPDHRALEIFGCLDAPEDAFSPWEGGGDA